MRARLGIACIALAALAALGCAKERQESAPEAPSASALAPATRKIPHIKMSEQARLRAIADAGAAPKKDPAAVAAGAKLQSGVAKQCQDDACKMQKCTPLCAQWFKEHMGDANVTLSDNKRYFDCIAACMFGARDAGMP